MIDTLWRKICTLELAPGETINEQSLCNESGFSRSKVRDVLLQMAADGALYLEANRAPRVTVITHDTLRHFFEAAPLVYMAAVRLASACATQQDIKRLRDIEAQLQKSADKKSAPSNSILNSAFYSHIGQMAANHYLMPGLNRLLIDHARLGKLFEQEQSAHTVRAHVHADCQYYKNIIEAFEQRDAESAVAGLRAHLHTLRGRMTLDSTSWLMPTAKNNTL
ncbi:GntR family transcriptional regulator [Pseudomonas sp. 3A(2025)]